MRGFSITFALPGISIFKIIILFLLCLAGFVFVHAVKMMRMYLIVMEQHIPFKRFVPAYLRTTLVNLIIPYKLGEVYRIGVFARITKSFNVGFFSVLVDRFFDTLALIVILLPLKLLSGKAVSGPVIMLTVFLLVVMFAYFMFPSAYGYLNHYIITSRTSGKSMAALKGLEVVHEWFLYVKKLVSGRYGLLFLFSMASWILELLVLTGLAYICGIDFSADMFGDYITSILSTQSTAINGVYTVYAIVIIAIATVIFTTMYLTGKKEHK